MPSVTFTTAQPVIRQELTPPPGATAVIIHFLVNLAPGSGNVRLAHLRTLNSVLHPTLSAEGRLPRESQICELAIRNGNGTAGFSGKGGKNATNPPIHMGGLSGQFPVTLTVPLNGRGAVVAAGSLVATSNTDIAPGNQTLELVLGMEPILGADLQPPTGSTISWDEHAVEWVGAQVSPPLLPPTPPAQPPVQPPAPPVQPPAPPAPPAQPPTPPTPPVPGTDPRAAAIALALQLLLPQLPPQEAAAIQAILPTLLSGGPINTQTVLLALLPLLLGGR